MAYGSRNTRSLSFSSDGTMELVALELDEDIQLSCQCGQCEKERKIWLDFPTDVQYASDLMTRIQDRYHLTSDIRLFFLSFYMAPTTPIFVMRMARGILKVMPGGGVMGGDRTVVIEPTVLLEHQQKNLVDSEDSDPLHLRCWFGDEAEELSPIIAPATASRKRRRSPTPYPNSPNDDLKAPKGKRQRKTAPKIGSNAQAQAQQNDGKKRAKKSLRSSVDPRNKNPASYFRSSTPDENKDPDWSADADRDGSIS